MDKIFWFFLVLVCTTGVTLAAPTLISGGRLTEQHNGSQLVFDLSDRVAATPFLLDNPPRLVIDIPNARLASDLNGSTLRSADVNRVRGSLRNGGKDVRLVMELRGRIDTKTSLVPDNGYRLVVDFFRPKLHTEKPPVQLVSTASQRPIELLARRQAVRDLPTIDTASALELDAAPPPITLISKPAAAPTPPAVVPPAAAPLPVAKPFVVAIDPGHGGRDPGAIGTRGTREKDVVMQIARRLQLLVDRQPGMRACLTRSKDTYLALYQRINIARQRCKAKLFVSIHADAYVRSDSSGASVFVLSHKNASSAMARFLAKHENESGGADDPFAVDNQALKKVLLDMVQSAVLVESRALGRQVLKQLGRVGKLHGNRRVEHAGFAVLKAPDFPSILVETAFISNPDEERKLLDKRYQTKLAKAILDGIIAYLDSRPQLLTQRSTVASR